MKLPVLLLFLATLLAGCATPPPSARQAGALGPPPLPWRDAHFAPPAQPLDASKVFELSPAMRQYAQERLAPLLRSADPRRALIEALYRPADLGGLQLRYDAGRTRNAAEAFDDRAGNCLSLVIMTAAFARHLDLPVRFQQVHLPETASRQGGLTFFSGHANLLLGAARSQSLSTQGDWLIVDFQPGADIRRQKADEIPQDRLLAMYLNNRAAEQLADGAVDEAYWAARAAVQRDPGFLPAANTLAVVYLRRNLPDAAEAVLRHVLTRDAEHTPALSNLLGLLLSAGRTAEAAPLQQRLQALQPHPPFHFHDLAMAALDRGDAEGAVALFRRELRRDPTQAESHHGLARAYARLGDDSRSARHLALAAEHGTTQAARARYAAQLARLRGGTRLQ